MSNSREVLAEFQRVLQREEILESYRIANINAMNTSLTDELTAAFQDRKHHFCVHCFLCRPRVSFYPRFFDLALRRRYPTQPHFSLLHQKVVDEFCSSQSDLFVRMLLEMFLKYPAMADDLTFCLLPSFFHLFASFDSQRQFVEFLRSVLAVHRELGLLFARAAFLLPEFLLFLQVVLREVSIHFASIASDAECEAFFENFLRVARSHQREIPPLLSGIAKLPQGESLFKIAFLDRVFARPDHFGFIQSTQLAPLKEWNGLAAAAATFCEICGAAECKMPDTFGQVPPLLPVFSHTYFFTCFDLHILQYLYECSHGRDFALVPCDQEWSIVILFGVGKGPQKEVDAPYSLLCRLLLDADPLPASETDSSQSLHDFLHSKVIRTAPSYRAPTDRMRLEIFRKRSIGEQLTPQLPERFRETSQKVQLYITLTSNVAAYCYRFNQFMPSNRLLVEWELLNFCFGVDPLDSALDKPLEYLVAVYETQFTAFRQQHLQLSLPINREVIGWKIWQSIPYHRFAASEPRLDEADAAFIEACGELTNQLPSQSRRLSNFLQNIQTKLEKPMQRIMQILELDDVLATARLLLEVHSDVCIALERDCIEVSIDTLHIVYMNLICTSPPSHYFSKSEWLLRMCWPMFTLAVTNEFSQAIPQMLDSMSSPVQLFRNERPEFADISAVKSL
jgi:hypothetical protein